MKADFGFEVVKASFYIKFSDERILQVESRLPNVTIVAVSKPHKNIEKDSLRVVKKGGIQP